MLTCQTDLLATCAELLGKNLPDNAGEDSESILPILKGGSADFSRKGIVHHSVSGHFSYRLGKWKLLLAEGSGGWTAPTEKEMAKISDALKGQLYDMEVDPGEQNNLYQDKPEVVANVDGGAERRCRQRAQHSGPQNKRTTSLSTRSNSGRGVFLDNGYHQIGGVLENTVITDTSDNRQLNGS